MNSSPIDLWITQLPDARFTDPAQCRERAARLARTVRLRNILEYAAGGLALVLFAGLSAGALVKQEGLIAAAGALCAVCVAVVLWQLHARASLNPPRPEQSCLDHLRGQYHRQYTALRSVPQWYLGPPALGLGALYAAIAARVADTLGWAHTLEGMAWPILATLGVFAAIAALNLWAARSLRQHLDALDRLD